MKKLSVKEVETHMSLLKNKEATHKLSQAITLEMLKKGELSAWRYPNGEVRYHAPNFVPK